MSDVQPGQAIPWSVLPEGSYRHPYESGSRARAFPFVADASVELPLSSSTLSLSAEGSGFSGVVSVQDDGPMGAGVVKVDLRMYYTAQRLSQTAQAWREQPTQGHNGVRIKVRFATSYGCGIPSLIVFADPATLRPTRADVL